MEFKDRVAKLNSLIRDRNQLNKDIDEQSKAIVQDKSLPLNDRWDFFKKNNLGHDYGSRMNFESLSRFPRHGWEWPLDSHSWGRGRTVYLEQVEEQLSEHLSSKEREFIFEYCLFENYKEYRKEDGEDCEYDSEEDYIKGQYTLTAEEISEAKDKVSKYLNTQRHFRGGFYLYPFCYFDIERKWDDKLQKGTSKEVFHVFTKEDYNNWREEVLQMYMRSFVS